MTQHHKNVLVLAGIEDPKSKGAILSKSKYPYMIFEKDTWRKQLFFKEAKTAFDKNDYSGIWTAVKKAWVDHLISISDKRISMKKVGRLNPEYILSLCVDNCPCCKRPLWYGRKHNKIEDGFVVPSLDRLNPKGEYVNENVWIICLSCNTKKNNALEPIELINIATAWHKKSTEVFNEYKTYYEKLPSLTPFLEDYLND